MLAGIYRVYRVQAQCQESGDKVLVSLLQQYKPLYVGISVNTYVNGGTILHLTAHLWKQNTGLDVLLRNMLAFLDVMVILCSSEEEEWNNGYGVHRDRISNRYTQTL